MILFFAFVLFFGSVFFFVKTKEVYKLIDESFIFYDVEIEKLKNNN